LDNRYSDRVAGPARAGFAISAALAVAAGVWHVRRNWAVITVEGPSMEPAFRQGDRVAVRRTPGVTVSSGDVVVIERRDSFADQRRRSARAWAGRRWMIKRVGAVAGEPVPDGIPVTDAVVPAGKLVLLGDNADASFDSRTVGYFSADLLLGAVVRRMG
jgi:signal peptidase I